MKRTAIVIGSGAGGAMVARELQGTYQVTVLEEGGEFSPFAAPIDALEKIRATRLLRDERMIQLLFPQMHIDKVPDMVLVRGRGTGGTTTLATGNAVRYDKDLRALGIDLDEEFYQLYDELPITTRHQDGWNSRTQKLYHIFEQLGLQPTVAPKLMDPNARCVACGRCVLGCPHGAKWDSRWLLQQAVNAGARLVTNCKVERLEIAGDQAVRAWTRVKGRPTAFSADLFVIAAGGQGTPLILEASGIHAKQTFFEDPVLCVSGPLPGAHLDAQLPMPFISQQDGYILAPYMDWLSFFFNRKWMLPHGSIASIMIKLADDQVGSVTKRGIDKSLTDDDYLGLARGVEHCEAILSELGIARSDMFLGTVNAGHPGGTFPLTAAEAQTLHSPLLPANCYVADASLFNKSMGNPPMLTIMALAKRIAKLVR